MSEEATATQETPPQEATPAEPSNAESSPTSILQSTPDPPAEPEAGAPDIEDGKFTTAFYDKLESDKATTLLQRYGGDAKKTVEALVSANALIGKKLGVPGDDPEPDTLAKFREVNGVPDSPEGYLQAKPAELPEGVEFDEVAFLESYAPLFHKINLTPAQAKAIMSTHIAVEGGRVAAFKEQQEKGGREAVEAAIGELKDEFGAMYSTRLATAQQAAQTVKNEIGVDLSTPPYANDPKIIRALEHFGSMVAPDRMAPPSSLGTPQSKKAMAIDIINNPNNPDHTAYQGKFGDGVTQEKVDAVRSKVREWLT